MNPTKELLNYINQFLALIPERFKDNLIQENFSSAAISISHPVRPETKLLIDSRKGVIVIQFNGINKIYPCNIFNYKKQVRKVWDDTIELIHSDKIEPKKPTLTTNQYALTFCEPKTGIVLEIETMKRRIGWGDIYKIFETKEDAVEYANLLTRENDIECTLLDSEYQFIQSI
jgi:hypothetical protein